jgi:hypothetical protein
MEVSGGGKRDRKGLRNIIKAVERYFLSLALDFPPK